MKKVKNLIIGGGLSGLTTAYFLKNEDYLILEKDSEVGGYCRTIPNKKYVWDYAGHFYHFRTEEFKKIFLSMVEPSEIVEQVKCTKIYYKDQLIDYPFQMNIHELPQQEFIDCLYDLYFKTEKEKYDNFLDMLYGKFGKSIVEKFLRPYNEKLYATDLTSLDTDAMGRFFPYADLEAIIKNMKTKTNSSYNDTFLYLKKGTGYFIDKLYKNIDQNKVRLNCEVASINQHDQYIVTKSGEKIYYENLINTAPLNHLLTYLDDQESLLKELSFNKVLVLNLGFDKPSKRYTKEHWVYFPDKSLNFYRIGFYNNILNTENLSVYIEIGFSKDTGIDIDKELKKALIGLKEAEIITDDIKLVDKSVIVMDPAYVHISNQTDKKVQKLMGELETGSIYTLGRYGKWTYSSMEDCMVWAKELATKLRSGK